MNIEVDIDASGFDAWTKKILGEASVVTAVITNDVFYVPRLEYGYSRQAPKGMVRVSLREIANMLAGAMQKELTKEGIVEAGTVRDGMVEAVNTAADFGMGLIRDRTPIRTGRARRGWRVIGAR